jgi:hypothetical protein
MLEGRKDFFFEKKKQKTFTRAVRAGRYARAGVLWFFFFQKKNKDNLDSAGVGDRSWTQQ